MDENKEIQTAEPVVEKKKKKKEKEETDLKTELLEWVKDIAIALFISAVVLFFTQPTIVKEHSMENTLHENDFVFVSKQSYKMWGEPKYGDIIVFRSALTTADGNQKALVKRIIALPGDTVYITGGLVYVNGKPIDEVYLKDGYTTSEFEEVTIEEGHLFCLGDNRQNSADSRSSIIGQVSMDDVIGKVFLRIYPFDSIGFIK